MDKDQGLVLRAIDDIKDDLVNIADKIWEFAEIGFQESRSAEIQAKYLEDKGFRVERNVADIPTAFVAEWGEGSPIIGFLGEYDALSGVSQEVSPTRSPREKGGAGHGCGHNLLGTAAMGAAISLAQTLAEKKVSCTVRYYGCPAEELLAGKVYMASRGLFRDLDVAITWHPGSVTSVRLASGNAMNSAKFKFYGKTAHAAGDPHNGRSALDAVELMNVGANYLREHVIQDARIHYVITEGGGQPNVVPAEAEVWYFVRAPHRNQVEEIYQRLLDVAKGAALMTGTTFEIDFLTGCYEVLLNEVLADVMWEALQKVGAPVFDEKDVDFARALQKTFDESTMDSVRKNPDFQQFKNLEERPLADTLLSPTGKGRSGGGSTDVGDVSWIVPTVQMSATTVPLGCPGHSWQNCASSGSSIGHKGMLVAAKAMGLCGFYLAYNPEIIKKAKEEFDLKTKDSPYKCPFPKEKDLPLDRFFG